MRITIRKNADKTLAVSIRRTRREEKNVPAAESVKPENLGATISAMVKEVRPEPATP